MRLLIIGAGVTGCFTAALLGRKGVDVSVLARGERADRLEAEPLRMRDGVTGEESTARLQIVRAPVTEPFDVAMVCVQAQQRPALTPLLDELPGRPTIWFLGNTTQGYDDAMRVLGADRVLGGFPGVGGTWVDDVLLYADREKPSGKPFDRLAVGEADPAAADRARAVCEHLRSAGMNVERHVPIMAWHWSHVALVLPLAGAALRHDLDLDALSADRLLLRSTMRATAQGLTAVRRAGHPILPRGLNLMRWIPAALGARRIASLMQSDFGRIAFAAHAASARDEMHDMAKALLALAGDRAGPDLVEVVGAI